MNIDYIDPDDLIGAVRYKSKWSIFACTLAEWILDYATYDPGFDSSKSSVEFRNNLLRVDETNAVYFLEAIQEYELTISNIEELFQKDGANNWPLTIVINFDQKEYINGFSEISIHKYIPDSWNGFEGDPLNFLPSYIRQLWDPSIPYSITRDRKAFLAECERLIESLEGLDAYRDPSEPRHVKTDRANRMIREYFDTVPILPLSRCPFCGHINTFSIDTVGLDGLWWTFPSRRLGLEEYDLCPHFLNLLGAVKLRYPVHKSSLQVKSGPEVPFVVPELIHHETFKAVVSQISIGDNIAYPIFYYSQLRPTLTLEYSTATEKSYCVVCFPNSSDQESLEMPTSWGQNFYEWIDENNKRQTSDGYLFDEDCDFEIASWVEVGKLLWIQPEDKSLTLHSTSDDCPYLELPGIRHFQRIENGAVRYYQNHDAWYSLDGETWMTDEEYRRIKRARRAQQNKS